MSIPQANLTKDNVETELAKYGVDDALIKEFMDILNTCEFARYAPAQASDAMDKLYEQTVDAIGKMENTIKKKRDEDEYKYEKDRILSAGSIRYLRGICSRGDD